MSTAPPTSDSAVSDERAGGPQGNSLTQDAWRKFRRDKVAVASLVILVSVAIFAWITPLLPLQPPDADRLSQQYEEPTLSPLGIEDFTLNTREIETTPEKIAELKQELPELEKALSEAQADHADAQASLSADRTEEERKKQLEPTEKQLKEAWSQLYHKHGQIRDTVQGPYRKAGYPKLGVVARWMVRVRYEWFGSWQLNSLCGRDLYGRDVLSRVFWGARISLIVGIVATLVSLLIGVSYGAVSGYLGGWVDNAMMRFVDILYSIPFIFVVIFVITILKAEAIQNRLEYYGIDRLTIFYLIVGAIYWLTMARVVRGQVISLKTELYVESARALGAGQARIIFRHLLPNVFSVVLVYLTLTIPRVMLFEAFLSFLGLGVEPPNVSWGLLANEGIQVISPVKIYWWLIIFPSLALGTTLLALNFLGDGLRDALDPRMGKD